MGASSWCSRPDTVATSMKHGDKKKKKNGVNKMNTVVEVELTYF